MRNLNHGIVLVMDVFLVMWKDGNAVENVVMQGQHLVLVAEIPIQRIGIIHLVQETDLQIGRQRIGNGVEFGNTAVVVDNGFGIPLWGFQMVTHGYVGFTV